MVVAILLAVFVTSLLISPAVILLWIWNQINTYPKEGKVRVGNGEKIISPYHNSAILSNRVNDIARELYYNTMFVNIFSTNLC